MNKSKIFIEIGIVIITIIIIYSIILYIILENTIPGGGLGLTMAQVAFVYNLIYIIPIGLTGIGLIYKGYKLKKVLE